MFIDFRCGQCRKLLARITPASELQIKCGRCRTLNHVKAMRFEPSPLSESPAALAAIRSDRKGAAIDGVNRIAIERNLSRSRPAGHSLPAGAQ
ncbi:Com family DNA-binding transcriptional regulator [Pseudomonas oryziphila]|uniref:Com family DNA-binding transcriptional regulator n=1 Tax=Pseudomonas oryziphila TaxID=2894079 RepID=A0ABN5TJB3_9PSED|nr:Com family DNA-binding transcriptional regulator [Pseudomonas oryziphila]